MDIYIEYKEIISREILSTCEDLCEYDIYFYFVYFFVLRYTFNLPLGCVPS